MADYKKMYLTMCNAFTDAVEILKKAQAEAEEEYIKSSADDEKPIEFSLFHKSAK